MPKATREQIKKHNTRLVLKTIYDRDGISRADIARATKLTKTTISSLVGDLIEDGLVEESGVGSSAGGKPPILLGVVDESRHYIGVDLANSEFRGAVANLRGKIVHHLSLPARNLDGQGALNLVYRLVDDLIQGYDKPIHGIGIGTPGLMDAEHGIVLNAVNLDWNNLPLGDILASRYNLPINIANDSQAAALAEYTFGHGDNHSNIFVIKLGRGVGAGIIINGELFYGDHYGAGEIGHVVIKPGGDPCRCGNHGCLETLISSRAIKQHAIKITDNFPESIYHQLAKSPDDINADIIQQAYQMGDEQTHKLVKETGNILGKALSHAICTLNIRTIVIAGSLAIFGDGLRDPTELSIQTSALAALAEQTRVVISELGEDIVVLGAISLLLKSEHGVV